MAGSDSEQLVPVSILASPFHAFDQSMPSARRPARRGHDDVVTRQISRNAVNPRASVVALTLLLALVGCGPESTKTVPDDLIGVWKTSEPKYADRPFQLSRDAITFWTGGGESYTRTVARVTRVREDGNVLYTVFYVDPADAERFEFKLAFYYDGSIRWKNRRDMAWAKERH